MVVGGSIEEFIHKELQGMKRCSIWWLKAESNSQPQEGSVTTYWLGTNNPVHFLNKIVYFSHVAL